MTEQNLIIAEVGSVHDGSFGNALKLVELSNEVGANVIKFQTHISEFETLKNAPNPSYFNKESRYDYFNRTSFTRDQWIELIEYSNKLNIKFLSSPFSIEAAQFLNEIGCEFFKVASGEVNNTPLLEELSKIGKPVLLSSGMSNWDELDEAFQILKTNCDITILQCSSIYPCPYEQVGLNVMQEMKERYKCKVGFSDHTSGLSAPIAAAALGASVIEKHLTFSKKMYGSDAKNSMEPLEFSRLSSSLKEVWTMLSNPVDKSNLSEYKEMKLIFEKSIVASQDIKIGEKLKKSHFNFKKPGDGIPAKDYKNIIGLKSKKLIKIDEKINYQDLE